MGICFMECSANAVLWIHLPFSFYRGIAHNGVLRLILAYCSGHCLQCSEDIEVLGFEPGSSCTPSIHSCPLSLSPRGKGYLCKGERCVESISRSFSGIGTNLYFQTQDCRIVESMARCTPDSCFSNMGNYLESAPYPQSVV